MNFADDPLPRMTSFKKSTELSPQELFRPQPITLPQGLIVGKSLSFRKHRNGLCLVEAPHDSHTGE